MHPLTAQAYQQLTNQGFKKREAQEAMMKIIHDTFLSSNHPVVIAEAGTGTGKTFGYLLPLIPIAKERDMRIVVSTGTIALQEQLMKQDIPLLQEKSGLTFRATIAKGRRNYLCLLKHSQATSTLGYNADQYDQISDHMNQNVWDGDFDKLPFPVAIEVKQNLSTDSAGCSNGACAHFDDCYVMKAKKLVQTSDVVVTNHAMLISDLQIDGGGIVLPKPDGCYHVIDEAHNLPDEVISRLSFHHQVTGASEWLVQLINQFNKPYTSGLLNSICAEFITSTEKEASDLVLLLNDLYKWLENENYVNSLKEMGEREYLQFVGGVLPEQLMQMGKKIARYAVSVYAELDRISNAIREIMQDTSIYNNEVATFQTSVNFYRERVDNLLKTWFLMVEQRDKDRLPVAKWVVGVFKDGQIKDVAIHASEISGHDFLQEKLWNVTAGAVLTSATLSTFDRFDHFMKESGLDDGREVNTIKLSSPFDYANRAVLEVPNSPDPKNADHTKFLTNWINNNVSNKEGVLVLCTSMTQLRQVKSALSIKFNMLVQGDAPRSRLIELHKKMIDEDKGSILIGVDSFGEGLNLPGKYLTHLIIGKLPFPVPSHPVEKERHRQVESRGLNPFSEISMPHTARKLNQWVGRLLRTEEDYGRVTIMDSRLRTKGYGKQLLKSLPPMTLLLD